MTGKIALLDKQITSAIKSEIVNGDLFYLNAFRTGGFITKHTQEHESHQPLYDVVKSIYSNIISEQNTGHEKLSIYTELRHSLEEMLGEIIANEKSLQQYELWVKISKYLRGEHHLQESWINTVPTASINLEKHKFSTIPKGTKLSDLANFSGYGRNNEQDAANYLSHIAKAKSKPLVDYLHDASRSSDLLTFKEGIYLQQILLKKAGIDDWLLFIDSLCYPNLQDHTFLWVDELYEYTNIIQALSTVHLVTTPKEHLLIITLENYFDFLDRTITELYGMSLKSQTTHNNIGPSEIIEEAKKEFTQWMENCIPNSFERILNVIFPDHLLKKNTFFNTFFDWINSHTSLHYTHHLADCKIKLLDTLNDIFVKRLSENEEDAQFLLNSLEPHQVNYEALKKLVTVLTDKKPAAPYNEKLLNLYIHFIESDKFSWYADGNIDFAAALNNTYYFSQVLNTFSNAFERWAALFYKLKVNHDGWLKTPSDYKRYQRESFIFCAGAGLAYNNYSNKRQTDGQEQLFNVLNLLLQQLGNSGDINSIDYATPLKFASIAIGEFDKGYADAYLNLIAEKCDKLKHILIAVHTLLEYHKSFVPSENLKNLIRKRIDGEFWIIESKKADATFKNELEYYTKLKTVALELCQ